MARGEFQRTVAAFADAMEEKAEKIVRATAIGLLKSIVLKSPVGNPELWAANQSVVSFNNQAAETNAALRMDPANLTKAGRLRKGIKLKSRKMRSQAGYVGGRFRGNWQVAIGLKPTDMLDRIDPNGGNTVSAESAKLANFTAGQTIHITNNLPYGHRLEFEGHSRQAPAGMVRVSLAEFQNIFKEAIASVKA